MNMSPQRFGGLFTLSLAATFLVAPALAQTASENPLRKARRSSTGTPARTKLVQPASHTVPASPIRATGDQPTTQPRAAQQRASQQPASQQRATHQLASNRHSVLTPRQEQLTETNIIGQELIEGDVIYEDDIIFEGGPAAVVDGGCCDGSGCFDCCMLPCPKICFDNFEVFGGVQGFTGPVNRGGSGSFGFQEGFNWGAAVPCCDVIGGQIGLRATQTNLSGAEFTNENRKQLFLTGGLFRRVDWGLQGGVVVDYLWDDWYANTNLGQLRGELSWVYPCLHELGFWFAASIREDTQQSTFSNGPDLTETFESTDLYAFFYRHHFDAADGANARLFAGWTGDGDGLIGADLNLPLSCDWALQGGFAYLIPEQGTGQVGGGHVEESWNVGISLVWYPGARSAFGTDYYRPLFNVADNGSFMVGRR